MLVKVSASGPWGLGHVMGAAGVGVASVCTGQAAVAFDEWCSTGRSPDIVRELQKKGGMAKFLADHQREMLADAMTGLVTFCLLSGFTPSAFRRVMASDVCQKGAFARDYLPAKGAAYATGSQKGKLERYLRRHGCHTCGTKKAAETIGDHMPPNKYAHGTDVEKPKYLWWRIFGPPKQKLFPQCNVCSQKQSTAVRMNRRELVPHAHIFRLPTITGLIVGLAPYYHTH